MQPETSEETVDELYRLSQQVIGCAYAVSNSLGCGFLEKVYENVLAHALRKAGLKVRQQSPIRIYYDGALVGEYAADLLVECCLLVELKAVKELDDVHLAQCLNYLKATGLTLFLLMNFGSARVAVKRIVKDF
ncbi:MAG: GxxExxY protein [Candidatus Brocadiia bacterium]